MGEFKTGEIVDITLKGVRIITSPISGQTTGFTIADEHNDPYRMPPQAAVERVGPAEWPPQMCDLWRDRDDDLWFAVIEDDELYLRSKFDSALSPDELRREYGPLTLVHREEASES